MNSITITIDMTRRFMLLPAFCVLCLSSPSCSQTSHDAVRGRWEGLARMGDRGMELIIDISISDSRPTARVTVPRERLLAKRLQNLEIDPPQVLFSIPVAQQQAPFRGRIRGDSIIGTVSMGTRSLEVLLHRVGDVPTPPYREEEARFANGTMQLSGSLLIPPTVPPHPAIILIHGSSTPDRDDFRFYADLFVRRGVAALIYDKRSTGGQLGGMSQVDLRDLAGDVVAAVNWLKKRDDIDPQRIGLWGHSQGGWVAPIAAAQLDSVAFVVGFSAPGVTYSDLDKYANAARLKANGFSQSDIDQATAALTRVDNFVRHGGRISDLQAFLDTMHRNRWASFTTLPRLAPTPEDVGSWLRWRNLDLDPVDYWRTIRSPVLLLYGERDDVVPVHVSANRIREALHQTRNSGVTVKIFPGEDHTISGSEDFLDLMLNWVVGHAKAP